MVSDPTVARDRAWPDLAQPEPPGSGPDAYFETAEEKAKRGDDEEVKRMSP